MSCRFSHWTHKYKPITIVDVIGHVRAIRDIKDWLRRFSVDSPPILFIYGPSGSGKTMLATLLLHHFNYRVFELNAGEIRSKKRITTILERILDNQDVNVMTKPKPTVSSDSHDTGDARGDARGTAIVMDEVDGMSCGDKGGLHQLYQMVSTKFAARAMFNPVICISNHRQDVLKLPKAAYIEITLRRPTVDDIYERLQTICREEGVHVENDVLKASILFNSQDVRKTISFVQELLYANPSVTMADYRLATEITRAIEPDCKLFDVTRNIFSKRHLMRALYCYYQIDPNLLPLMIHENVMHQLMHKRITLRECLACHQTVLHNLSLLDVFAHSPNSHMTSSWEMHHMYSTLSCGYVNLLISHLPTKSKPPPKIVFTNALTRSATQSTTHCFLSRIESLFNVQSQYMIYIVPIIVQNAITTPTVVQDVYGACSYADFDKILQIYQKCPSVVDRGVGITAKHRRLWKKFANAPPPPAPARYHHS